MVIDDELRDSQVTPWTRRLAPVREYVATENASAAILLAATVAAVVWANSPWSDSYERLWDTEVSLSFGSAELALDLRDWINDGLMAFFFFVVGLEIRREFDMGELRERRRVATPVLAADRRHGRPGPHLPGDQRRGAVGPGLGHRDGHRHGVRPRRPHARGRGRAPGADASCSRLVIVDDIVALAVIAVAYTEDLSLPALVVGARPVRRHARPASGRRPPRRAVLPGRARRCGWRCSPRASTPPSPASPSACSPPPTRRPARSCAGRGRVAPVPRGADARVRPHRQPHAGADDLAQRAPAAPVPPVDQLRDRAALRPRQRRRRARRRRRSGNAASAPILPRHRRRAGGRQAARHPRRHLAGLPALARRFPAHRPVAAAGRRGHRGRHRVHRVAAHRRHHVRRAAISRRPSSASWRVGHRLAGRAGSCSRSSAACPGPEGDGPASRLVPPILDLAEEVDPEVDHVRGPVDAPVTLVEYGDFECPYCGRAEPVVHELVQTFGNDLRFVFRHLPLVDVHEHAELAAEAAEAAAAQGRFWEMHDILITRGRLADLSRSDAATPATSASTSSGSSTTSTPGATRCGSPATSPAPTPAGRRHARRVRQRPPIRGITPPRPPRGRHRARAEGLSASTP